MYKIEHMYVNSYIKGVKYPFNHYGPWAGEVKFIYFSDKDSGHEGIVFKHYT